MELGELSIDELIIRIAEGSRIFQFIFAAFVILLIITRMKRILAIMSDLFLGNMDDARTTLAQDQAKLIDQNLTLVKNYQEMIEQYQKLMDMLDKTQPSKETLDGLYALKDATDGEPSKTLSESDERPISSKE